MLPAALNTDGFTHEQCAQYAAQAGYEIFALQASGWCLMGTLADVANMQIKLNDYSSSTCPCVRSDEITCKGWVNKVFLIGALSSNPSASRMLV
jgi:hypothetical protein